ncbi:YeeE/YedE family protein [Lewinella sp. 4G2]|uniref:YeeE/YedE family protein n=1 Tax=Lewinella sp. 4G2 TaxID=1803372 RepID=UPI0007B4682A|nr:YeeE/YedE thiosulfate transporter family protein [Lewinella sp. 4G2]OAV44585.1 YeeE/YedE family protein [Lewinella sp. 4G2]
MLSLLKGSWHWSVSGLLIAGVMFALLYAGKQFGVSSNLRTMCTLAGAGKHSDFFRFDWKAQRWNLLFIAGAVIGGFIASTILANPEPVAISTATETYLSSLGIDAPSTGAQGTGYVPHELFSLAEINWLTLVLLVLGGFLIGFGTRWAGGCTSGHAISGLSNLQVPSLIAVVGFFAGGLLMTWLILPQLLNLVA